MEVEKKQFLRPQCKIAVKKKRIKRGMRLKNPNPAQKYN